MYLVRGGAGSGWGGNRWGMYIIYGNLWSMGVLQLCVLW